MQENDAREVVTGIILKQKIIVFSLLTMQENVMQEGGHWDYAGLSTRQHNRRSHSYKSTNQRNIQKFSTLHINFSNQGRVLCI